MDWGGGITYFGKTAFKGAETSFGIKDVDRKGHIAVLGRAEYGRAELLANLALSDIERGVGALILDAQGDLAKLVLERAGSTHQERIIFLDPSDGEYPFSWNPLQEFRALPDTEARAALSRALASTYRVPPSTLMNALAERLLKDTRASIVTAYELVEGANEKDDPKDKDEDGTDSLHGVVTKYAADAKLIEESGRYLAKDSLLRNLLGQQTSKFSLEALSTGGIVVVDLSRIRVYPTRVAPLARIFMHAARARAEASGIPVALYLHDSLRTLSESDVDFLFADRAVAISVSDTALSEEDRPVREKAISRSVSVATFSPPAADLKFAEQLFYPYVNGEELSRLEKGEFVLALSIDGVRSRPFFAHVMPLSERVNASYQDIIATSRDKYTIPRSKADQLFRDQDDDDDGNPGSFSDTFRSIFAKRAGGVASPVPPPGALPGTPAPRPAPPAMPQRPASAPAAPRPAAPPKPVEIPEDDLKAMLYVEPVAA